jgi:anti-sigma regulatory factor (Ser/Thr protein kinase)
VTLVSSPLSITLRHELRELLRLAEQVERFGAAHQFSDDFVTNVNLVLDEMVSNVIKYGKSSDDKGGIDVSLALDGTLLTIEIADAGGAFNPIDATPPDLDLPITERPVGGLGIHIVKALTESIVYRRENERNHLTMTMRVGAGEAS